VGAYSRVAVAGQKVARFIGTLKTDLFQAGNGCVVEGTRLLNFSHLSIGGHDSQDSSKGRSIFEEATHLFVIEQIEGADGLSVARKLAQPAVLQELKSAVESMVGFGEGIAFRYVIAAGGFRSRAELRGFREPPFSRVESLAAGSGTQEKE